MDYGTQVLSDPLVVDAIESLFVPACVYNNTKGDADARVLKSFGEPTWNNPVVRFVDAKGKDIRPRLANDWSRGGLIREMTRALRAAKRPVPAWLDLLRVESKRTRYETAIFGMS